MRILVFGMLAGTVAAAALAQYSEIPESALRPMLITDTRVQPDDSPLVRVAKLNVARRQKAGAKVRVVDVSKIGTSDSRGARLPRFDAPEIVEGPVATDENAAAKAALEKKTAALKQEQQQIVNESDEPYGGDMEEDRVEQRMQQIPAEVDQSNRELKVLQTPAPPPPPD